MHKHTRVHACTQRNAGALLSYVIFTYIKWHMTKNPRAKRQLARPTLRLEPRIPSSNAVALRPQSKAGCSGPVSLCKGRCCSEKPTLSGSPREPSHSREKAAWRWSVRPSVAVQNLLQLTDPSDHPVLPSCGLDRESNPPELHPPRGFLPISWRDEEKESRQTGFKFHHKPSCTHFSCAPLSMPFLSHGLQSWRNIVPVLAAQRN